MPYQVGFSVSPVRTSQVKGWTLGDALSNWAPFTLQPFKSEVVGGYSYPRELQVVLVVKELACHYRRHKRLGFDPQAGKIPWRRAWQPTPGFLPGESLGQRSLVGYSPWGHKESDTTERLSMQACTPIQQYSISKTLQEIKRCDVCNHWIKALSLLRSYLDYCRGTRDQTANICWIIKKSKRVPRKYLLLLYWLHQSLWLCRSQQTVENYSRDGNTRPPDLPPEKSVCRPGSNS